MSATTRSTLPPLDPAAAEAPSRIAPSVFKALALLWEDLTPAKHITGAWSVARPSVKSFRGVDAIVRPEDLRDDLLATNVAHRR